MKTLRSFFALCLLTFGLCLIALALPQELPGVLSIVMFAISLCLLFKSTRMLHS